MSESCYLTETAEAHSRIFYRNLKKLFPQVRIKTTRINRIASTFLSLSNNSPSQYILSVYRLFFIISGIYSSVPIAIIWTPSANERNFLIISEQIFMPSAKGLEAKLILSCVSIGIFIPDKDCRNCINSRDLMRIIPGKIFTFKCFTLSKKFL